jgi:hypothetical protein
MGGMFRTVFVCSDCFGADVGVFVMVNGCWWLVVGRCSRRGCCRCMLRWLVVICCNVVCSLCLLLALFGRVGMSCIIVVNVVAAGVVVISVMVLSLLIVFVIVGCLCLGLLVPIMANVT